MNRYNMILIEQHIGLNIYQNKKLESYEVIQTWKEDFDVAFKVLHKDNYLFTLVIRNDCRQFELSKRDIDLDVEIDWQLYSNITASLYSVFLKDQPS
jgi:hypothetical protein